MNHPMQGYYPYEGSDEMPELSPEESKAAARKVGQVMKERSAKRSSERKSSGTYEDSLVGDILETYPQLTPEKAQELIDHFA